MGNTKKRIKRSKRVKMRKAKNTKRLSIRERQRICRKIPKKKTKQRGRGHPRTPWFSPSPKEVVVIMSRQDRVRVEHAEIRPHVYRHMDANGGQIILEKSYEL